MLQITLDMYQTLAAAVVVLMLGRFLRRRVRLLERFCIPAPVIGGVLFAVFTWVCYVLGIAEFAFDDILKEVCMVFFFTSVGFQANLKVLRSGGTAMIVFLVLVIGLIVGQNFVAIGLANVLGISPLVGLCTGSIPMVGGHGTAGSYGPLMENKLGIEGANVLAIAAATFGLVSGSLMGGPTARSIINRYGLTSTESEAEIMEIDDENAEEKAKAERVDTDAFTNAAILLIVASGVGTVLTALLNNIHFGQFKLTFPTYIGAMLVAAVIRNFCDAKHIVLPAKAIDLWGNVSLSIFLAIALMTLKLWQLASLAGPMIVMLAAQVVLMFVFARFVVFNIMGRDYEAAVMTSAFCGFGMGATPNAMANMQVLTKRYGPAPQAYFIVPLVGSLFIDFFNGIIITGFMNILPMFG